MHAAILLKLFMISGIQAVLISTAALQQSGINIFSWFSEQETNFLTDVNQAE